MFFFFFLKACPTCENGVCDQGIEGTGLCNCNAGWVEGSTGETEGVHSCDACAQDYFGSTCEGK